MTEGDFSMVLVGEEGKGREYEEMMRMKGRLAMGQDGEGGW